ncbi:MAG TPA: tRNA adenosine(34) deaminase TadA [Candidatus Binatia bacterium]|nr:tRNA adenosine(34) deaminase TadA [Candidatus Binatia bacterium]
MITSASEYMRLALAAARQAASRGEIPVGAVIVSAGQVIATAYNDREERQTPLGHAEITAIQLAAQYLGSWRLDNAELYVTLEPCIMCAGAILQARISRLIFGCRDPKAGAIESLYRLCEDQRLNHQLPVTAGVLANESAALLRDFFARLRIQKSDTRNCDPAAQNPPRTGHPAK